MNDGSLLTTGHVHGDKRFKGLWVFPVLGDEKYPQETQSRSVEKAKGTNKSPLPICIF